MPILIDIPGNDTLMLEHLVLDFNGTLAFNGRVIPGVIEAIRTLADRLQVHVITADTFGTVQTELVGSGCRIELLPGGRQDQGKLSFIERLGCDRVVAIGNGRNDALMLKAAAIGIGVIQQEGAWSGTVLAADVVCTDIVDALDLLIHTDRIRATLRV